MKPLLRSRVEAAINGLEMKLEFRLAQREATDAPWVSQVRNALKNAREVLGKGDSSQNWAGMLENFLSPTLFKSHLGFLVIAFIAGFSERWIVNVVQAISRD